MAKSRSRKRRTRHLGNGNSCCVLQKARGARIWRQAGCRADYDAAQDLAVQLDDRLPPGARLRVVCDGTVRAQIGGLAGARRRRGRR